VRTVRCTSRVWAANWSRAWAGDTSLRGYKLPREAALCKLQHAWRSLVSGCCKHSALGKAPALGALFGRAARDYQSKSRHSRQGECRAPRGSNCIAHSRATGLRMPPVYEVVHCGAEWRQARSAIDLRKAFQAVVVNRNSQLTPDESQRTVASTVLKTVTRRLKFSAIRRT